MSWLLFLLVTLICISLGLFFLGLVQAKLTKLELVVVSLVTGITFWALLLYLTALIHLRWLSLVIVVLLSLFGLIRHRSHFKCHLSLKPWWLILTVAIGVAGQLFLVAPSGWNYPDGIRFYGVNTHDAMWHVTLMNALSRPFPIETPTFSGEPLKGYHFLIDLLGGEWTSVFHLSALDLVFRQLPFLFAVISGLGIYAVIKRLTQSQLAQFVGVFLTYFGGSLGFIVGNGETAFWAQQSISTFINLPLATSFAVITGLLILMLAWIKQSNHKILWIMALLSGSLLGIKAYGGVVVLGAFAGSVGLYALIKRKILLIGPVVLAGTITLLLLLTTTDLHRSSFIFEPGWFLKTMMEAPDRVNFPRWELLRQTYLMDHNYPRLAWLWISAFGIFLLGNLGSRIIGLLYPIKMKEIKTYWPIYLFLVLMFGAGVLMPILFIQSGVVWNAIQFFYYSLFAANLLTALTLASVGKHKFVAGLLAIIIVGLSLPTTFDTIQNYGSLYTTKGADLTINHEQMQILTSLHKQPEGIILSTYQENSYVSAFTGKSVYFSDQTQADILGLTGALGRKKQLNDIFCGQMKPEELKALMESNNLRYIYIDTHSDCQRNDFKSTSFFKQVFTTETASVYEYQ